MVRVEEGDLNVIPRRQLDARRRLQRYSLEQRSEMLVGLLAALKDTFGEVHAVRVLFKPEEEFSRGRGAVDEG